MELELDHEQPLQPRENRQKRATPNSIAVVFPKFHDIYETSYGYIDDQNGATFNETLDLATKSDSPLIQIATWNDYGEGTIIEPTNQFGFKYLETLQKYRTQQSSSTFQYTANHLNLPITLYKLRKLSKNHPETQQQLDKVSQLLFTEKINKANALIKNIRIPD